MSTKIITIFRESTVLFQGIIMSSFQRRVLMFIGSVLLLYIGYKVFEISRFYTLYLTTDKVVHIEKAASVQIKGILVGEVADVAVQGSGLTLTLKMNRKHKISHESEFRVISTGVSGKKVIYVHPAEGERYLDHRDTIALTEADGVTELLKKMGSYIEKIGNEIDSTISEIITGDSVVLENEE